MNKVFIVIPIYNAKKYLYNCLKSILNQTFKNFTCIMINDGSKDGSKEICKSFTNDKRFVLLNQDNKGVSTARNNGIKYALKNAHDDDFITFVDADDFLSESYFEKVVFAANNNPNNHNETLYMCGWNQITKTKIIQHKFEKNTSVLSCSLKDDFESLDVYFNTVWGNFYSAKQLKINKILFEESMNLAEDVEFNMRFIPFMKHFIFINECLYNYLENQNSLSRPEIYPPERINIFINIFIQRFKFLNENKIKKREYILNKHISNLIFDAIVSPYYKRLYVLKPYINLRYTRTNGQKRVLFCLKHNMLCFYRLYMRIKRIFFE